VRSYLLAAVLAAASVWGVVRELPEGEAHAGPRVSRPREVESVAFDGPRDLPAAALRDVLTTRSGDVLDAGKLAHDREALQNALVARGFLAAQVGEPQVSFDDDGGAFVTFAIAQGTQFHVRAVGVEGATAKDAGVVTLATGEVASSARLEQERQALATRLASRGKASNVAVQLASDGDAVDVTFVAQR
jgi:outer membrane protein assembly factor BamA